MKVEMLDISGIKTDGGTQSRASLNDGIVTEYADAMQAGAEFPPIVVFHDGSDHWLADGFHRLFAAKRAGLADIFGEVHQGTKQDALWFAIGANKANGARPSRGDIRHAIELALRTWPERTQVAIAEQIGCTQAYVSMIKDQFITTYEPTPPATVTGKDGKTYPTSKGKKVQTVTDEPVPRKRGLRLGHESWEVRAEQIRGLTEEGHRPEQIAALIGVSVQRVREIAKKGGITLADSSLKGTHGVVASRVIESSCHTLAGLVIGLDSIGKAFEGVTAHEASEWADDINQSLKSLRRFERHLRSIANG